MIINPTSKVTENVGISGELLLAWKSFNMGTAGLFFLLISFTPQFFPV